MQREIALHLLKTLLGAPGFSKFGGLVQTLTTSERATDVQKTVKYPITADVLQSQTPPTPGSYIDFVPNSAESGLLYFEHISLTAKGTSGPRLQFESKLRLVAWMQTGLASAPLYPLAQAQANLLRRLMPLTQPRNVDPFVKLATTAGRLLTTEDGLFSRYTYREDIKQYLLDPYAAFGIELTSTFSIAPNCLPPENGI